MNCEKIEIKHFRNIEEQTVCFGKGLNIIYGSNAQGKTNCLEALYMFASCKSFRSASDRDMISFDSEDSLLKLVFDDGRREGSELRMALRRGFAKSFSRNGVPIRNASDFIGYFRAVVFGPEHISMVRDGPAERRAFLDSALCQLKPVYMTSLQKYNMILQQRNALIKSAEEKKPPSFDTTLAIWSSQLAREAAYIAAERGKFVGLLSEKVTDFFNELANGREKIEMRYDKQLAEDEYFKKLTENTEREVAAGTTLYGIHRDDVDIDINGRDSRVFASQGQQRSIAFAMKMGEGLLSEEFTGSPPVYLLDDVLSELDVSRRRFVLESMRGRQVIVTTCIESDFDAVKLPDSVFIRTEKGRYSPIVN